MSISGALRLRATFGSMLGLLLTLVFSPMTSFVIQELWSSDFLNAVMPCLCGQMKDCLLTPSDDQGGLDPMGQ